VPAWSKIFCVCRVSVGRPGGGDSGRRFGPWRLWRRPGQVRARELQLFAGVGEESRGGRGGEVEAATAELRETIPHHGGAAEEEEKQCQKNRLLGRWQTRECRIDRSLSSRVTRDHDLV